MSNPNNNPNCDNDKCADRNGETRLLPYGPAGCGNLILCNHCYSYEMAFRNDLNPDWNQLKIVHHKGLSKEEIERKIERLESEQTALESDMDSLAHEIAEIDQEISDLKDKLLSL